MYSAPLIGFAAGGIAWIGYATYLYADYVIKTYERYGPVIEKLYQAKEILI